jgi:hypothetical protein
VRHLFEQLAEGGGLREMPHPVEQDLSGHGEQHEPTAQRIQRDDSRALRRFGGRVRRLVHSILFR